MEPRSFAKLLRIFIGELDKVNHKPLYEEIVLEARKQGLAGATVIRGIMSYGATSIIHTTKILALTDELPIIIEIVDTEDRIEAFLKIIEPHFAHSKFGALVTLEKVEILRYSPAK
jgi:uncharacterized protein